MISARRAKKKIRAIRGILGHTCVHTTAIKFWMAFPGKKATELKTSLEKRHKNI